MGNCRFRLSDMIPNAWFYKLKDMSKIKNHNNKTPQQPTKKKNISSAPSSTLSSSSSSSSSLIAPAVPNNDSSSKASSKQPHQSEQRKSYYFTRNLDSPTKAAASDKQEPPRKSSRRRRSTRKSRPLNRSSPRLVSSTISNGCSCRATIESVWTKPEEENTNTNTDSPATDKTSLSSSSSEHDSLAPEYGTDQTLTLTPDQTFDNMFPSPCKCMASGNDNDDVVIDLPPINTKIKPADPTSTVIHQRTSAEYPEKNMCGSLSVKVVKEDYLSPSTTKPTTRSPVRRFPANSGVKLRTNSPKINSNRRRKSVSSSNSSLASSRRTSVSESSFAVVKTSKDPRRDFRESMVEMIVENKIKASKDLEELLACYLSLNSDEYHDLIINVFKQIWFDFVHVRIK